MEARALPQTHEVVEEVEKEKADYTNWSHESLIERVTQLENEWKSKNKSLTPKPPTSTDPKPWRRTRNERIFEPSKYNTRFIALKLAYLGKNYNGFEYSPGHKKPLPTIEEELWWALNKAHLIFPRYEKDENSLAPGEVNWEGTEYSKCGRTDKGVNAFGQVIAIRVRSARPMGKRKNIPNGKKDEGKVADGKMEGKDAAPTEPMQEDINTYPRPNGIEIASPPLNPSQMSIGKGATVELNIDDPGMEDSLNFDPIADEIPYCSVLNKLLPPDIRIQAWCPAPPVDFNARFSCRERQYKYYFTNPCFHPMPRNLDPDPPTDRPGKLRKMEDGWLDISAMQKAAKLFEGLHDFRNYCKIDPGKQISNFDRRIFSSYVKEETDFDIGMSHLTDPEFLTDERIKEKGARLFSFNLCGSAFLWHQVRHMVAILFLIGQGLEDASLVSELLDVTKNPRRPAYELASDTPLVLWDCIFPHEDDPERKDALQWNYVGESPGNGHSKYGTGGLMDDLWEVWRERKIDDVLAESLVKVIHRQGPRVQDLLLPKKVRKSQKAFDGGDIFNLQGNYVPVMKKTLMEDVESINEKYAVKKGFKNSAEMKAKLKGFKGVELKGPSGVDMIVDVDK